MEKNSLFNNRPKASCQWLSLLLEYLTLELRKRFSGHMFQYGIKKLGQFNIFTYQISIQITHCRTFSYHVVKFNFITLGNCQEDGESTVVRITRSERLIKLRRIELLKLFFMREITGMKTMNYGETIIRTTIDQLIKRKLNTKVLQAVELNFKVKALA